MARALASIVVAFVAWLPLEAGANDGEFVTGTAGGLLIPAFRAPERTSFASLGWTAGAFAETGLSTRWSLGLGFTAGAMRGIAKERTVQDAVGSNITTDIGFHGALYHPQMYLKAKLRSGYVWAPYVEAGVGYLWATYVDPQALDPITGENMDVPLSSFGEGSVTMTAGLSCDVRLFEFLLVGVAVRYTEVPSGILRRFVHVPITLGVFW